MKSIFAFAALVAMSATGVVIPAGQAHAQSGELRGCAAVADRIAREQTADRPTLYDSFYERAFSQCVNNGDNPFTELPTGDISKICQRVPCQKAW